MTVTRNSLVFRSYRDLNRSPRVQVNRLDLRDVDTQVPVNPRATDAKEQPKVPRGPTRTCKKDIVTKIVSHFNMIQWK